MAPIDAIAQPWADVPPTGRLFRPKAAAEYLGCSLSTYYAMAAEGRAPRPIKIFANGRASGVPQSWLSALVAARAAEALA